MRSLSEAAALMHRTRTPGGGLARRDLHLIIGWTADVARELGRLDDRGIYHGEVSPETIRIGSRGAGLLPPEVASARPEYRDPERMRALLRDSGDDRRKSARADVYGLGASLFAALEGGPPSCGPASSLTLPVPKALAHVVYRALAEGAARYPSADAMRIDLDRLAALSRDRDLFDVPAPDLPGHRRGVARASEPLKAWRPRRRSRRFEIGARIAVLVLLIAGGVATAVRVHDRAEAPSGSHQAVAAKQVQEGRPGLPGLLDRFKARLTEQFRAVGETFDPAKVPLLVVSDVSVPRDLGWPVTPSASLARSVRAVLHDGVTPEEVQRTLAKRLGTDTLPAVLWVTKNRRGKIRARLYYSGLFFDSSLPSS